MSDEAKGLRALTTAFIQRIVQLRQAGITFNGRRNLNSVLGYADLLSYDDYRARYDRGGLAGRAVDILPNATWRGEGEVIEDEDPKTETKFENEFRTLNERIGIWPTCLRADKMSGIGGFSVILLGAEGTLDSELPRGNADKLKYLMPFSGGLVNDRRGAMDAIGADVTVKDWDTEASSARFGRPLAYNLRRTSMTSPSLQVPVHWTRVIHVPAEGFLDDPVFGPPKLQRPWNYFDDLDKVCGGGAEAFWLRANQPTLINIDKDMKIAPGDDTVAKLQEQADLLANQMTRIIRGRGVNLETAGSDVANFKDPVDAITTLIAGCLSVPKRILLGSEMGELASTQDRENWQDQINDRRTSYALPIVLRPLIMRLQEYGYLAPAERWSPGWANVINKSETEKADGAKKWSDINAAAGEVVFTDDEIRSYWYGFGTLSEDKRQTLKSVERADHLSANEKRRLTGIGEYTGDPDIDPVQDVPLTLLPKETMRITDPNAAPANTVVPITTEPQLPVAATAKRLEAALERGGSVHLVVTK